MVRLVLAGFMVAVGTCSTALALEIVDIDRIDSVGSLSLDRNDNQILFSLGNKRAIKIPAAKFNRSELKPVQQDGSQEKRDMMRRVGQRSATNFRRSGGSFKRRNIKW